jgi:hypothetical protein
VPFTGGLPAGKKVRIVIEVQGPLSVLQQRRFRIALQKLLKQHHATIRPAAAKKKRAPRRKS